MERFKSQGEMLKRGGVCRGQAKRKDLGRVLHMDGEGGRVRAWLLLTWPRLSEGCGGQGHANRQAVPVLQCPRRIFSKCVNQSTRDRDPCQLPSTSWPKVQPARTLTTIVANRCFAVKYEGAANLLTMKHVSS